MGKIFLSKTKSGRHFFKVINLIILKFSIQVSNKSPNINKIQRDLQLGGWQRPISLIYKALLDINKKIAS